jgi:ABC-type multidrug transport system fused ATPase/permease subunit
MLKKLWQFASAARVEITAGLVLLILSGGFELLQPWPVKWLVDHVLGHHPPSHLLGQWLPSLGSTPAAGALTVCGCVLLFACAHRATQFLSNLFLLRAGEQIVFQIFCPDSLRPS